MREFNELTLVEKHSELWGLFFDITSPIGEVSHRLYPTFLDVSENETFPNGKVLRGDREGRV